MIEDYELVKIPDERWGYGILIDGVLVKVIDVKFEEDKEKDHLVMKVNYVILEGEDPETEQFKFLIGCAVQDQMENYKEEDSGVLAPKE